MGILYFISVWRGRGEGWGREGGEDGRWSGRERVGFGEGGSEAKFIKFKKKFFFLPIFNKFVLQNNPPMQLCLIFYKTLRKIN